MVSVSQAPKLIPGPKTGKFWWLADDDWGVSDGQARNRRVTRHPEACRCRKSSKVLSCTGSLPTHFSSLNSRMAIRQVRAKGLSSFFSFSLAWSPCPPLERSKTPSHQISAAVARFFGVKSSRWTCLLDRGPWEQEFPYLVDRTVLELTSSFTVLHGLLIQPNFLYLRRILLRVRWVDLGS